MKARRYILQESQLQTAPGWMITFSDLCMLLVSFFVLILSMSQAPNQRAVEQLRELPRTSSVYELLNQSAPGTIFKADTDNSRFSTDILGAFSTTDSDEISFRGKSNLLTLARLSNEMKLSVEISPPTQITGGRSQDWGVLTKQLTAVSRQMVDAGVLPSRISIQLYDTEPEKRSSIEPPVILPPGAIRVNLLAGK